MTTFPKTVTSSALLCLCFVFFALLQGCGNKGGLFLVPQEDLIQQIFTIEDAMDELEAMEAEEDNAS